MKIARTTAYFASRAGKPVLGEKWEISPLRPYGDNALSRNEIEQMASYRSYSVTGPKWVERFLEHGLVGLADKPGRGGSRKPLADASRSQEGVHIPASLTLHRQRHPLECRRD